MSNELTDVRCPCGAEFQADSYDAGFIAGSGMCQNCDAALPPKDICTCPSGDGSLVHPCPAHPAPVEQAGGDERAALQELIRVRDWVKNRRGQPEKLKNTGQTYIMIEKCETLDMLEWAIERARAALAHAPTSLASPSCKWTESSGIWETSCGQTWSFIEDGPAENGALFCHHCGGRLVLIKSDDQEDDGEPCPECMEHGCNGECAGHGAMGD